MAERRTRSGSLGLKVLYHYITVDTSEIKDSPLLQLSGMIIYYTGLHPYNLKPVYAARSKQEKKNQHLFFFWHKRENQQAIRDKLKSLDREDLVEKLLGDRKRDMKKNTGKARVQEKISNKKTTRTGRGKRRFGGKKRK